MDTNESVRSDGIIVAWKLTTSILYSFQVLGAPVLVGDKVVESYGIHWEKGRLVSRIDIALDVKTFSFLCLK